MFKRESLPCEELKNLQALWPMPAMWPSPLGFMSCSWIQLISFWKGIKIFALVLFHGLSSHVDDSKTTQEWEFSGCAMIWVDATLSHSGPTTNSPTFHSKTFPITVSVTSLPTSLKDWFHVGQKTRPFQTSASSKALLSDSCPDSRCLSSSSQPQLKSPCHALPWLRNLSDTSTSTSSSSNDNDNDNQATQQPSKQASKQAQQQPSNQATKQQRLHLRACRGERQLLNVNQYDSLHNITHNYKLRLKPPAPQAVELVKTCDSKGWG